MNIKDILIYVVAILFLISLFYPFYIEYKIKTYFEEMNKVSYYKSIKYLKNLHSNLSKNSKMFPIVNNILWHYRVNNYIVYLAIFLGFVWYLIWGKQ
jgi:hypothetical protein